MARPGRPERNRTARSFRQLRRFHHVIHSNRVFGTHRQRRRSHRCAGFTSSRATNLVARRPERSFIPTHTPTRGRNPIIATAPVQSSQARARGKIPIAPTAPSVPHLPRFRALALFGRRPPVPRDSLVIPAPKDLQNTGSRVTRRSNGSTKQPLDVKGTVPPVGNFGAGGGTVQATNARRSYLTNRVGTVVLIDIK